MLVYYEAGRILDVSLKKQCPVKTLCYNSKFIEKKQLLALVSKTTARIDGLNTILESLDKKICHQLKKTFHGGLLYVVLHERFFSKGGIRSKSLAAKLNPFMEELRAKVSNYKQSINSLQLSQNNNKIKCKEDVSRVYDYCVRVNTLKITIGGFVNQMKIAYSFTLFESFEKLFESIKITKNISKESLKSFFVRDIHFNELFYFYRGVDLHENPLYIDSSLIIQSKASCMAALALNPTKNSFVIDACSAPGNKTSLLAAKLNNTGKIFACELDQKRFQTLKKLLESRNVTNVMSFNRSFLELRPFVGPYASTKYILVDPSCSGSGTSKFNKNTFNEEILNRYVTDQINLLNHALSFPKVKRVVYSTCSVLPQENENVVKFMLGQWSSVYRLVRPFSEDVISSTYPKNKKPSSIERKTIRIDQMSHHTEGFYIACFERIKFLKHGILIHRNVPTFFGKYSGIHHRFGIERQLCCLLAMERIVNEMGEDFLGRPIIGINAAYFGSQPNYDAIFEFIHTFLYDYASRDFVMVYFPQGLSYWNRPSIQKMAGFYKTIDRGVGKSMKLLLVIEPPGYYNVLLTLMRPFLNEKVLQKIHLIASIDQLFSYVDLYSLNLPTSCTIAEVYSVEDANGKTSGDKSIWFNTSLKELSEKKLTKDGIPIILIKNIEFIEKNGLDEEGLMRVPPLQTSLDAYMDQLDEKCSAEIPSVKVACSIVKKFFRSLHEPILPQIVFNSLTNFKSLSLEEKKQRIIHDLQYMRPINVVCFQFLANLIDKISANSSKNQMNYANLAVCLAPSLLWHTSGSHSNVMGEINNLTHYVTAYFENHKQLS